METATENKSIFSIPFLVLVVCYTLGCLTYQFLATLFVSYGVGLGYEKVAVAGAMSMTGLTGLIMRPVSSLILAAVIYGFSFGGCIPVLQAVVIRAVEAQYKASATATKSIGGDISLMAINTGLAALATAFGTYKAGYFGIGCIGIVGLVYIIAYFTYYNRKHPGNPLHW